MNRVNKTSVAITSKLKKLVPRDHIKRRIFMIALVALICVTVAVVHARQTRYVPLSQPQQETVAVGMLPQDVVEQAFTVTADAAPISLSAAFAAPAGEALDKPYTAQILKPDGSVLVEAEFGRTDIATGGIYLGIPVDYDIRGQQHTLRITSNVGEVEEALAVLTESLPEGAPSLRINGEETGSQLLLGVGYRYVSGVFWAFTLIILAASAACILLWRNNIANNVLLLMLVFGLLFCFISPILDTPDETTHFEKSLMVSNGDFFRSSAEGNAVTESYVDVVNNRALSLVNTTLHGEPMSEETVYADMGISQLFIGYLPQGLGLAIARGLNLGILPAFYMGRVFNLVFYAILAWLAIKNAKKYKLFLGVMALMPMSLFLAGSYNPDSYVLGLSLILVSYFINMYFDRSKQLTFKNVLIFTLLCVLISIKKYNYAPFLFLLFFIPAERFARKRTKYLGGLFAFVVVAVAVLGVFYAIASSEAAYASGAENSLVSGGENDNGANMYEQIAFILANKGPFLSMFLKEIVYTLGTTLHYAFSFGWTAYGTPSVVDIAYYAFLALVAFSYTRYEYDKTLTTGGTRISMGSRIGVALVMFAVVVLSYLMMYLGWTAVGTMAVWGVQGRYMIPALLLLPMIGQDVSPLVPKASYDAANYNIIFVCVLFLLTTLFATGTIYYVA